jgi:hypothetical protein
MNDLSDTKTKCPTTSSRVRRHRSLDLRLTKQIRKKTVTPTRLDTIQRFDRKDNDELDSISGDCKLDLKYIYSDVELDDRRLQLERLCDEFENMNDGSAFRRFLMSRLDSYIVDMKMHSARPVLCDNCGHIVIISSCKTCDMCLSFYCRECAVINFTREEKCCFCEDNRTTCDSCVRHFSKCSLCGTKVCKECVQSKTRKSKSKNKIYCGTTAKCKTKLEKSSRKFLGMQVGIGKARKSAARL